MTSWDDKWGNELLKISLTRSINSGNPFSRYRLHQYA